MWKKLCILVFTGCATPNLNQLNVLTDERLSHYVNDFLSECRLYLPDSKCSPPIDLRVIVTSLPDNILGQCSVYEGRLRTVELDNTILTQYNEKIVMYHELYHCVLGIPHYDNEPDIMNTYENDEITQYIYNNWSEYTKRVFTRENN